MTKWRYKQQESSVTTKDGRKKGEDGEDPSILK